MEITYEFGVITVDEYAFNETRLSTIINKVFNLIHLDNEYEFTPCEIVFHRCMFKDTSMTLYDTDTITLDNEGLLYAFKGIINQYYGEYMLNLTIVFEYCEYFACAWGFEMYPPYIPVYNSNHDKIANLGIFIESNKLEYFDAANVPSYPASIEVGYKILCERISSHVNKYYICRVSIPRTANAISLISGEVRTDRMKVEKILSLIELNSYNYSTEVFNFIPIEEKLFLLHTPFTGSYNTRINYSEGNTMVLQSIETNSYKSLGPGYYLFKDLEPAIRFLNRVVAKNCNIIERDNGRVEVLSTYLLSLPDVYRIKS